MAACWLALAFTSAPAIAAGPDGIRLPDFGDASEAALTRAQEKELAEAFLRELRSQLRFVEDGEVLEYVRQLGHRLVAASDDPGRPFRFMVVDSPRINAFAGPGGIIGLNSGLILATRSESELAGVMAHEIAHVTQRHIPRAIQSAQRASLPAMAGMLAAIVLASQNSELGKAALASIAAGSAQQRIDFTRRNEQEADRVGIAILASAGFDPNAMASFFERLQESQRYYREPPEFLSTHPVSTTRIADARGRAAGYPYRQYPSSLEYLLVKAKLRALTERDPARALAQFEAPEGAEAGGSESMPRRYGRALALLRQGRADEAVALLETLNAEAPERLPFRIALAQAALAAGDGARAERIYRETLALYPGHPDLVHGHARLLLEQGRPDRALPVLQSFLRDHSGSAETWRLLAEAHDRLGQRFQARVASAEFQYRNGQLQAAIRSLEEALTTPDADGASFYDQARAQARLEALRQEFLDRAPAATAVRRRR